MEIIDIITQVGEGSLFLTYFIPATAIVTGIISPVLLLIGIKLSLMTAKVFADLLKLKREETQLGKVLSDRWIIHAINTCPNPDYIEITLRNVTTKHRLIFSCDKKELKLKEIK